MKSRIINPEPEKPKFRPITLELTLETEDEARLMFAALDCTNLKGALEDHGTKFHFGTPQIMDLPGDAWEKLDAEMGKRGIK